MPVAEWQITAGPGIGEQATVPISLADLDRPARLTLLATVTLPEAWRGRPLSFCIPTLRARAALRVLGEQMPSSLPADGWLRRMGPQLWHIPALYVQAPQLVLELTVEADSRLEGRIVTMPRLSLDPAGDRAYRSVRSFSALVLPLAPILLVLMAFVHALIWSLDRRQAAYGWFAAQGLAAALYAGLAAGALFDVLGSATPAVAGAALSSSAVGAVYFMHRQFGLGRVPRYIVVTWVMVLVCAALLAHDAFLAERWFNPIFVTQGLACVFHLLWLHGGRVVRGAPNARGAAAILLLAGWGMIALASVPEAALLLLGHEMIGGFRIFPVSTAAFAAMQTIALSIEHARSLRAAQLLNDELRRKIADRSRALLVALGQSSGSAPLPSSTHETGDVIEDRYRVELTLGRGGMGTVYQVERLADGRRLALKRLARGSDPTRLARFAREAQIAASVEHPNLVAIVDVDVSRDGGLFLVMELVAGGSLRDADAHFGERRWSLRILAQVAEGLSELHRHGMVHRDLKPGNILLEEPDSASRVVAKIADFGVSTLLDPDLELGDTHTDTAQSHAQSAPRRVSGNAAPLTHTGALVGTPLYMAPEQAVAAKLATAASDIYSFGLVAHEMLSGTRHPRLQAALTFGALTPALPRALAELLDRCLSVEAPRRPSAAALVTALVTSGRPDGAGSR